MAGGVASGFQHVTVNDGGKKRLFQVKGKRNVRVREIGLSISNMNKGDCFILEDDRNIYVYVGPTAKRVEKLKAISAANQIRDQDHNGRASIHILGIFFCQESITCCFSKRKEEWQYNGFVTDEFSSQDDRDDFFRVLGSGSADQVPEDTTAEEDSAFETKDEAAVTLYKVSDSSGSLKVDTISTKPIRQEMLRSEVSW